MKFNKRSFSMKVLLAVLSLFLICITCKADRTELEQNAKTTYNALIDAYNRCIFYKGKKATNEYMRACLHGSKDALGNGNDWEWYYLIATQQREFRYHHYNDVLLKTFTSRLSLIRIIYELFYKETEEQCEANKSYEKYAFLSNTAVDSDHWTKSKSSSIAISNL